MKRIDFYPRMTVTNLILIKDLVPYTDYLGILSVYYGKFSATYTGQMGRNNYFSKATLRYKR